MSKACSTLSDLSANPWISFQGLLGWYMVKSGLDEELVSKSEVPRVSQYRLASHLSAAFVFYSGLFWCALCQLMPHPQVSWFNLSSCGDVQKHQELVLTNY